MAAVDYTDALELGWRIFPIYPIKDGQCSCEREECHHAGKHPKASNWQNIQPYDDDQLAYLEDFDGLFFGNQLIDHYGIVTNTSGLLIVDVDGRNGGFESAKKLAEVRAKCGFIVATGSGAGEHWYFKNTADAEDKLRTAVDGLPGIDFKSSGYVVGCGSLHASGYRYEVLSGKPADITDAPAELIELLKRPARKKFVIEGRTVEISHLAELLEYVQHDDAQSYDRWVSVGMALHHATDGSADGEALWCRWSERVGRTDTDTTQKQYASFGRNAEPITEGTLISWAKEGGYIEPVTFVDDTDWGDVELPEQDAPAAEPTNFLDVLPPGSLVGALFDWINGNCLFPRENIAFGAAVQAVSNIAGLNYRVAKHGTTLNLISFAIADSGTGKEAVYQSLLELMRAAGVAQATHGSIKSEQELIRNLIRNQASLYVIDEYGTDLAKIAHAKKGTSANYLVAVPETIMKIFTKANAYFPVTGDMAEEQRERLERQKSALQKQVDDAKEGAKERLADVNKRIQALTVGIPEPYLTFFGISEPTSFDAAIESNLHLITNGFIGRALIFREDVGVPELRSDYAGRQPLPWHLEGVIKQLYQQGNTEAETVERTVEDPIEVPLTEAAERELKIIYQFWRQEALILESEGQGLHSIPLRAREMVIKLAAVFAVPADDVAKPFSIEAEHIAAAQKITAELMRYKIGHCKTVLGAQSKDSGEKGSALLQAITAVMRSFPDGITIGVIRNRLRSFERQHVEDGIKHLMVTNKIREQEYRDGRNRLQKKYHLN